MGDDFFERNRAERNELIEGLIREGNLVAFAGPFGMGKTPLLADLTVRLIHGLPWCGRRVARRPVILFDCETPGPDYRKAITAIAARLKVSPPRVPDDLDVYLERDPLSEPGALALLKAVSEGGHDSKLRLIESSLDKRPNALVIVDPLEMFFRLDTSKKIEVLGLYRELRTLLAKFQEATLLGTFNLRKRDKRGTKADLLSDARDWLEEVCGSLDLLNRSDVRLGIDTQDDDIRVINGILRGRETHPILIRSFRGEDDQLAGFEQVTADDLQLRVSLSSTLKAHWDRLPQQFKFEEAADKIVPRSTLSRLIRTVTSLGVLVKDEDLGVFRKTV